MRAAVAFLGLVLTASCATMPSQPAPPALPDTVLGQIAAEWLATVNSGSTAAAADFVARHFSERALRDESAEDRIRLIRKLQVQSGGIDIVEVTPASGERPMTMLVRSRRGGRYASIILGLDRASPEKLAGLGISISDAPESERRNRWPADPANQQEVLAAVRNEIDRRAAEGTFSGVVLVGRGDDVLLHVAHGWADRDAKVENALDTRFHLASVGKMFTAAAIAQLVSAGKLSYDSKIIDVLPDYPNRDIASKVTVRQLLTHTSGLGTYFGSPGFVAGRTYPSAFHEIAVFRDEPLYFEPGARWRYSNAGYVVLAAIIERLSGHSFRDYLRLNIFEPLGMTATYEDMARNVSLLYTPAKDDPMGLEPYVADRGLPSVPPNGFGGGYSTAIDLFRFARAYPEVLGFHAREINGTAVRGHAGGGRADVEMLANGYTMVILANKTPPPANSFGTEVVEFLSRHQR